MLKDDTETRGSGLSERPPNTPTTKSTFVFHDLLDVLSDKNQMHALIFFIPNSSLNGDK